MSAVANTNMPAKNNLTKKRKNVTTGENEECKKQKTSPVSTMTDTEMETVVTEIIWRYYPGEKNVMSKFSGDNIKDHAHKSNVASIKFFGDIQEHISTEDVQADVTMKDLTAAPIVAPIVMEADNDAPIDEVDTAVVWDYKIICKMISRYIKLQKQDKLRQDPM